MTETLAAARSNEPRRDRFEALDALRGIAALVVVLVHYDMVVWDGEARGTFIGGSSGYLAVDFFILLSGFVLAHAAYDRPGFALRPFMLRRVFRLWPLHLFTLSVLTAWRLHHGDWISATGWLSNATLTQSLGFGNELASRFNVPSWSLSVELAVNLACGALLVLLPRGRLANVVLVLLSMLAFVTLWVVAGELDVQNTRVAGITSLGVMRGFLTFPIGILVYRLYRVHHERIERLCTTYPALQAVVLLLFLVSMYLPGFTRLDFLSIPLYAITVLTMACSAGRVAGALSHIRALGALSFAIYLVHYVVERIYADTIGQSVSYFEGLVVVSLITLLVSTLLHVTLERPMYTRLSSRIAPRSLASG